MQDNNGAARAAQDIAAQDAARLRDAERQRAMTRRRRGHKGSRVWGFDAPTAGTRGGRR